MSNLVDMSSEQGWPKLDEFDSWKPGLFAFVSACTLPIGYVVGALIAGGGKDKLHLETSKEFVKTLAGFFYCFGAGSLLFGLLVELYASSLAAFDEADNGDSIANLEISLLVVCSMIGAVGFYYVNKWFTPRVAEGKDSTLYIQKAFAKLDVNHDGQLSLKEFKKMFEKSDKKDDDATEKFLLPSDGEDAAQEETGFQSVLLGSIFDSLPEAMMMAFLASRDQLTISFVISIALANFPQILVIGVEGFNKLGWVVGPVLFTVLTLWTTVITEVAYLATPNNSSGEAWNGILTAVVEGLASGSMLNLVFDIMIPEGVRKFGNDGRRPAGSIVILGFLVAAAIRMLGMKYG